MKRTLPREDLPITERSVALDRVRAYERPQSFVESTDFTESYLVTVEYWGTPSATWLAVTAIERDESTIHLSLELRAPELPFGDDFGTEHLTLRFTDTTHLRPTTAVVTIDGDLVDITT